MFINKYFLRCYFILVYCVLIHFYWGRIGYGLSLTCIKLVNTNKMYDLVNKYPFYILLQYRINIGLFQYENEFIRFLFVFNRLTPVSSLSHGLPKVNEIGTFMSQTSWRKSSGCKDKANLARWWVDAVPLFSYYIPILFEKWKYIYLKFFLILKIDANVLKIRKLLCNIGYVD